MKDKIGMICADPIKHSALQQRIDELKAELETYKKALELMAKEIEDINPDEDINDYNLFICEVVSKYLTKAKEDK